MNAAIVLIQSEIEALQIRRFDCGYAPEREKLDTTIGELCEALDFLRMNGYVDH